jgi:hypothetical protein
VAGYRARLRFSPVTHRTHTHNFESWLAQSQTTSHAEPNGARVSTPRPEVLSAGISLSGGIAAALLACMLGAGRALAWSSKDVLLFEAVHQKAIKTVLSSVTDHDLDTLMRAQDTIDKQQKARDSYKHSMTGVEGNDTPKHAKAIYIKLSDAYVRERLETAIWARKRGANDAAFDALGAAIHALQDATSPSHYPFQPWTDDESVWAMAVHIFKERVYPDGGPDRTNLEGAVRYAYDIFVERTRMPDHFYDLVTGYLVLPPEYKYPVSRP